MLKAAIALAAVLSAAAPSGASGDQPIREVHVSRPFFNPSAGQVISIGFSTSQAGYLTVAVLDRDGFLVRSLRSRSSQAEGRISLDWDGRDDAGRIVPDEAYSLKIDLDLNGNAYSYFPANEQAQEVKAEVSYYDRRTAVVSYHVPVASRVHMQAGLARANGDTGALHGPVLRTIVNREPRPAGADIEIWDGMDEFGSYYIPDLPNFVMAAAATALPENSIITSGNRKLTYLEWLRTRSGSSLLTFSVPNHHHHAGLSTLDDVAPTLSVELLNAHQDASRIWSVNGPSLSSRLNLTGPSAATFRAQPNRLLVFIDTDQVADLKPSAGAPEVRVALQNLSPGVHVVAFDWVSEYGPVAAASVRVRIAGLNKGASNAGGR